MRQILYLTANDRLGVLTDESKVAKWKEKYQIVRWWYADEVVKYLNRNREKIICPNDHSDE